MYSLQMSWLLLDISCYAILNRVSCWYWMRTADHIYILLAFRTCTMIKVFVIFLLIHWRFLSLEEMTNPSIHRTVWHCSRSSYVQVNNIHNNNNNNKNCVIIPEFPIDIRIRISKIYTNHSTDRCNKFTYVWPISDIYRKETYFNIWLVCRQKSICSSTIDRK
jgi:hypothetical protein